MVGTTLRYMIEQVGGVDGVYLADDRVATDFLVRRTVGNAIELLGIVAFRAVNLGRCCMNTLCRWGGVARTSLDPPQEPHYGNEVEGSSHV